MSLHDTANETFTKQTFIGVMFASFERIHAVRLETETAMTERGHTYVFYNAVLNTRLGTPISMAFKSCGENGGLTVKGTPCKKNAVINGRCAQHPGSQYRCCFDIGHVLPEVHLVLGDDARFRPLPAMVSWKDARMLVDGNEYVLMDLQSKQFELIPISIVWNELICNIKDMMALPAEFYVTVNNVSVAADLLWSVGKFMTRHHLQGILRMQDAVLQPGYLLGDYHLKPNAILST